MLFILVISLKSCIYNRFFFLFLVIFLHATNEIGKKIQWERETNYYRWMQTMQGKKLPLCEFRHHRRLLTDISLYLFARKHVLRLKRIPFCLCNLWPHYSCDNLLISGAFFQFRMPSVYVSFYDRIVWENTIQREIIVNIIFIFFLICIEMFNCCLFVEINARKRCAGLRYLTFNVIR